MSNIQAQNRKGKICPILLYPDKCTGCRICQLRCSIRQLGEFNPEKSYIKVIRSHGTRTARLELKDDCKWCGYCARFCNYGALVFRKAVK